MQNYQANIEDLSKCTVAIQKTGENGRILGTGIIVTDDGLILTCYHVIRNKQNKKLDNEKNFNIYFANSKEIEPAQIIEEYCNSSLDIAFLELQEKKIPDQAKVALLSESIYFGNSFASIGFRKPERFDSLTSKGEIRKITNAKKKDDTEELIKPMLQIYSDEIEPGMSGAPVLDLETNRVIGIISEHWITTVNVDTRLNFAIPVESIVKVYPELEHKNEGLGILEFLGKIGTDDIWYRKIDELYVPPMEYEDIEEALNKHRIVFLTGTKEYGKTYTAVKLLWEYHKKGYKPKYIQEKTEELPKIIERLLGLDEKLKHHIIYFDDPVGKTEYRPNEKFGRHIANIIDILDNLDTHIIITMREEIYNDFRPIGKIESEKYVKKLNIGKRSYDYEKRKEMLLKWAQMMNCTWLAEDRLKKTVLEHLKNESILPTPLNIKDFVMATDKKHGIFDEKELLSILNARSMETIKSFAEEIKGMYDHKILFLCFPLVSDSFSYEFVKHRYEELVKELMNEGSHKFENVVNYFKDDKISITYDENMRSNVIGFSHPSYFEAMWYTIFENNSLTQSGKILTRILLKLAEDSYSVGYVIYAIAWNYNRLPDDVRNLLFKLADDKKRASDVAGDIARAIAWNYNRLPDDVRNLLFKLADDKKAAINMAIWWLDWDHYNLNNLPDPIKNELLSKLSHHKKVNASVARAIAWNYNRLSDDVRSLMFKLSRDAAIMLPDDIVYNYNNLPENIARNLMFKLSRDKNGAGSVAQAIVKNYNRLPDDVRNLLFKLADDKKAAGSVADAIVKNYNRLPDDVRNLLFKLADDKKAAGSVADAIAYNFDNLPDNERNELLRKLVKSNKVAKYTSEKLASQPDKLPLDIRNELFKE